MKTISTLTSGNVLEVIVQDIHLNGEATAEVVCEKTQQTTRAKIAQPFSQIPKRGERVILWRTYYPENPKFLVFHSQQAVLSMLENNKKFMESVG